MLMHKKIKIC